MINLFRSEPYAWAYADQYRLQAAAALERFAAAGGDPEPLVSVLALPPELLEARKDGASRIAFSGPVP